MEAHLGFRGETDLGCAEQNALVVERPGPGLKEGAEDWGELTLHCQSAPHSQCAQQSVLQAGREGGQVEGWGGILGRREEEGRVWSCCPCGGRCALLAPKGPVLCSQFSGVFFEPLEQQVFSNSCSLTFRCEDPGNVSTACRGDRAGCCRVMSCPVLDRG